MNMNMNMNMTIDSVEFDTMNEKFYERVDHHLLGNPDITQKRIYLSIRNYLTKNNIEIDDEVANGSNYYDIFTIDLCKRFLREIYYFKHDSNDDYDTITVMFDKYIELLKDIVFVIENHIVKKIENISKICMSRFINDYKGNIDNIGLPTNSIEKYIVDKCITDEEKIEYNELHKILYNWLLMELKVMDYLFNFIIRSSCVHQYFKRIFEYDCESKVVFLELAPGVGWECSDFISRKDAKLFLGHLCYMEEYFNREHSDIVVKKTFDSIEEVRKNIYYMFNMKKGDEDEDSEYDEDEHEDNEDEHECEDDEDEDNSEKIEINKELNNIETTTNHKDNMNMNNNDECRLNVNPEDYGITFVPLVKLSKKKMDYVEDTWHHATLTSNGLTPDYDCRYNDFDYEFREMLNIIKTYGVKPPKNHNLFWNNYDLPDECRKNDGELLKFAMKELENK